MPETDHTQRFNSKRAAAYYPKADILSASSRSMSALANPNHSRLDYLRPTTLNTKRPSQRLVSFDLICVDHLFREDDVMVARRIRQPPSSGGLESCLTLI